VRVFLLAAAAAAPAAFSAFFLAFAAANAAAACAFFEGPFLAPAALGDAEDDLEAFLVEPFLEEREERLDLLPDRDLLEDAI
jgi:hypothetical protein